MTEKEIDAKLAALKKEIAEALRAADGADIPGFRSTGRMALAADRLSVKEPKVELPDWENIAATGLMTSPGYDRIVALARLIVEGRAKVVLTDEPKGGA